MKIFHITALITLSLDVPEPKSRGIRSGYAPHHKFARLDYLVSGFHAYEDNDVHYPGEVLEAKIAFPSWEFFSDKVKAGDVFEIRELDRVIGSGVVQSVKIT